MQEHKVKADPAGVLTGAHFIDGDHACSEGAIAAGCRFVAGYPITPSTEVVERISERFPFVGGVFIHPPQPGSFPRSVPGRTHGANDSEDFPCSYDC